MYLIALHLSIVEIAVLLIGAVILGFAIHFFIVSRRSLKQALENTNQRSYARPGSYIKHTAPVLQKTPEVFPQPTKQLKQKSRVDEEPVKTRIKNKPSTKEESVENLKETILQQQKLLNGLLHQVEEIENDGNEELEMENKHLQNEIKALELQLGKNKVELTEAKQQASISERMAARIEEVYQEFEQLQAKMIVLEKQAARANNLALELEDTREAYEQIHKDLQRKTEKLDETFSENQRLQQQLNTLEDKLAEANLQRQQLQKKVQFLQDLNTDLQTVSDTNKKLQTELRRIGELESMLDMIAEERDYLLKKQSK